MDRVTRTGVSLEPKLLKKFDEIIEKRGYSSRSEAIRDLIREEIARDEVEIGEKEAVGTITIIYEHDTGDATHKLLHIQHNNYLNISSTMHIHLDRDRCLEVLFARGKASDIKDLAEKVRAVKGVKFGEACITTME